jgi:addiction module HigA family antidote
MPQKLATEMGRPYQEVNACVNGDKAFTPDTAMDLGCAFGTSAVYWMNLETAYRLHKAGVERGRRR